MIVKNMEEAVMYKQLIVFSIGAVINIFGCVAGYFAGQLWGGIICVVGSCIMLAGTISIGVKHLIRKKDSNSSAHTP